MKIAVMTDVHGNLPALQAALRTIRQEGADAVYHTGDAIGIGPFPAECLELMLSTPGMKLIRGNHDSWFADGLPEPTPPWMSDAELEHQNWVHSNVNPAFRNTIGQWPYRIEGVFEGVRISFLHYALTASRDDFASVVRDPRPADLDRLFTDIESDLVFYGHDHWPSDLIGKARYVNPGSLGCHSESIARFVIVECDSGNYELKVRHVPYDDRALFEQFESRDVPHRQFIYQSLFGGRNAPAEAAEKCL